MFNDQTVVEASKGGDLEDVFEEIANQLMRMAATKMSRAETQTYSLFFYRENTPPSP